MSEVKADELGLEPIEQIIWEDAVTLRPGVDFRDGVTYFTIPGRFNQDREVKKGRKVETVTEVAQGLICVASQPRNAWPFTKENVAKLGFTYPRHVMSDPEEGPRWSTASIQDYINNRTTAPDPELLQTGLRNVYETYVEFSRPEYYDVLPLYIMGSYLFRLFRSIGYIHFNGTKESGKSQNLNILSALSLNAQWASSMSAAALYRSLAGQPGLVCIDEAEGFEGERGEELRRILNAGYLDGATVKRAEKSTNDAFVVASYQSYGPKAIASIAPLDYVIGSRCLIVSMRPSIREPSIPEFQRDGPQWQRLRDRLYLFAMYYSSDIAALVNEWNETIRHERAPKLIGRQWQITQLYLVLADFIDRHSGGDLCDRLLTFFNAYFADIQRQQDATDRIRIVLKALPRVLDLHTPHDGGFYYLKTIHEVVSQYLEEDAKEYFKTRNLSKHLDVLGFRNKRSQKQGTQIWLDPDAVRQEFNQRRVEPHPEDSLWLLGQVDYRHDATTTTGADADSLWAERGDEA